MAVDYNAVKCKNSYLLWKVNEQFCNSKILFRPFFSFAVYTHFVECKKKLNGNNETERERARQPRMRMSHALFYYQLADSS